MANALPAAEERDVAVEFSQASLIWQRFRRHRLGFAGLVILLLRALLCIAVPPLSPFDYSLMEPAKSLLPAGSTDPGTGHLHLVGTDYYGRDVFTRLFQGGRASLFVALLAAFVTMIVGSILG